jgi:hypothetical protein
LSPELRCTCFLGRWYRFVISALSRFYERYRTQKIGVLLGSPRAMLSRCFAESLLIGPWPSSCALSWFRSAKRAQCRGAAPRFLTFEYDRCSALDLYVDYVRGQLFKKVLLPLNWRGGTINLDIRQARSRQSACAM